MKITRRQFLKGTVAAGVVAAAPGFLRPKAVHAFYQSPGIPLFGTTLRGVGPGGIPVAVPGPFPAPVTGVTHYQMLISQFQDQIVPDHLGLGPTTLWGYNPLQPLGGGFQPQKHLGGIIVGQRGVPIQITFHNLLFVNKHIIPVDTTIPGAKQAVNRTAVHFHGGLVPWISDGGPFDWWGPLGTHGMSFLNNRVLNPFHLPGAAEYYYPLNQSARFGWYHDHAIGITRLNAYAGIASALLIRDTFENGLIGLGLPNYVEAGGNEIPLVFQDKIFVGPDIKVKDPGWSSMVQRAATYPGSLWYAHTYEPNQQNGTGRWDLGDGGLPLPDPSNVPEFFGDTMLVNGTTFPEATVEARRYRLRLLNACNARFLNLQLYIDDGSPNGITLDASGAPKNQAFVNAATGDSSWLQIGTEGGFLSKPVKVPSNQPLTFLVPPDPITGQTDPSQILKSLIVAPAERPDIIIDFSSVTPGTKVILYSDAPAPFPSGDDRNDYFPGYNFGSGNSGLGNPANTTHNGFGPNTRVLMRFNVVAPTGDPDPQLHIDTTTDLTKGIDPFLTPWGLTTPPPALHPRFLSLNEYFDEYGRLIQILGNAAAPYGSPLEGSATYLNYAPSSTPKTVGSTQEDVKSGDTEVWEIFNTTGDVHPMHFHLVNIQVINRQLFDVANLAFTSFTGPVIPPEPNELGWKETVPMYPGTVTRVIMKFDLSQAQIRTKHGRVIPTPPSPRTGGAEYVWHCHILEHEEHDMMHALVVK
jgi:spore coat protein A, manganese oxidase